MKEDRQFLSQYSDKVIDHFLNPKNAGIIENANGVGEIATGVRGFYAGIPQAKWENQEFLIKLWLWKETAKRS